METAMNATELMDPKTDSGFNSNKIKFLEEIVKEGELPDTSTLSLPDQVALMDVTLPIETGYYRGFDLTQTILSCYYLQDNAKYAKGK